MAEGTPKEGETSATKAPENGTQTPAPDQGNAGDQSQVEKLKVELKEAQQKAMRVNQVENELAKIKEAEEKKKQSELEEQNKFKDLYEQEKAKRESMETEVEAEKRRENIEKAKSGVLADYPDEVKELAEEAGMKLESDDEDAVNAYKEKLDKIKSRIGTNSKVGPNNPGKPSGKPELSGDDLKVALKDPNKFHEIVSQKPGIAAMMNPRNR